MTGEAIDAISPYEDEADLLVGDRVPLDPVVTDHAAGAWIMLRFQV